MPIRAIFRDQDRWCCLDQPAEVLLARQPTDVLLVIEQVEKMTRSGMTAVGFVSYEAAGALDDALDCDVSAQREQSVLPLACFLVGKDVKTISLPSASGTLELTPEISEASFNQAIDRIKGYLEAGDTYQVNFTHRLSGTVAADPTELFSHLYRAQPSPYALMIELQDFSVCSVSPELFFELDGNDIRCEPMKGTRSRGRYPKEDIALKDELAGSTKDRAENLMIVDMIRNDLGRVARPGTVTTDALFTIKQLPTVWQQVSSVAAETDADLLSLFRALFPCASVTGAPRARTMALIRALEDSPRGVYTGALGVVKPDRQARFSVGIRTLTLEKQADQFLGRYGVGGGIVWDSDATEEWQESLTKSRILQHAQPDFELLETMLFEPGNGIGDVDLHLARLAASADYFDYTFDEAAIRQQLASLDADANKRVRLLLGPSGKVTLALHPAPSVSGTVSLRLATEAVQSDDIFLFHKTTHRQVYEQARQAVEQACDDVVLWNERGELTETTIYNLILEFDGQWVTPHLDSGLLAGTCREALISQGRLTEKRLMVEDLGKADRLFVCNSLRGVREAVLLSAPD